MLFNKNIKKRDIIIVTLILIAGYIAIDNYARAFDFIVKCISIVAPFIYSLVIAYCLNPIMNLFEKKFKFKRGWSILSTYVLIIGVIIIVLIFVIPTVIDSIISITSEIPTYVATIQGWIDSAIKNEDLYNIVQNAGLLDYVDEFSKELGTFSLGVLQGSISSIFLITANIAKIAFGFLVSIYILIDKDNLIKGIKILMFMILKEEKGGKLLFWIKIYNKMIGAYIGTRAVDSIIIGIIALVGLIILKSPYAILLAIVVGITNMIPYFGPLVGQIIGGIVGIFVSPAMAIKVVIFLLILQQFDSWYLEPKLVENKIGVKPFFIILGISIGGGLFGTVGMLLSSPTIATLNMIYDHKVAIFKARNKNLMIRVEGNGEDIEVSKVDGE
jgi:predicted PurR-regulated permease PerM